MTYQDDRIQVMSGVVCINMTWTVRPFDTKPVRTHDQRGSRVVYKANLLSVRLTHTGVFWSSIWNGLFAGCVMRACFIKTRPTRTEK